MFFKTKDISKKLLAIVLGVPSIPSLFELLWATNIYYILLNTFHKFITVIYTHSFYFNAVGVQMRYQGILKIPLVYVIDYSHPHCFFNPAINTRAIFLASVWCQKCKRALGTRIEINGGKALPALKHQIIGCAFFRVMFLKIVWFWKEKRDCQVQLLR